ncbi:MAG: hypothetical protein P8J32_09185, partial [bacterium]|nr:hypothetical protein [bacterium]
MNNNKRTGYMVRKILIVVVAIGVVGYFGNMMWNSPSVNSVDADEFVCTEHEEGAKYDYTVSYRGRSFLVGPKHGDTHPIYDLANGEAIPADDNDYSQVLKCIRMYNFHKDGIIGKSPAELRNGEMIVNDVVEEAPADSTQKDTPDAPEE